MRTKKGSYSLGQILQRYATKHNIQGKDEQEREKLAARKIAEEFVDRLLGENMPVDAEKAELQKQIDEMRKESEALKNQQKGAPASAGAPAPQAAASSSTPMPSLPLINPEASDASTNAQAAGFAAIMAQLQNMQAQQTSLQNQVNNMQSTKQPETFSLNDLQPSNGAKLEGSIDSITTKKVLLTHLVKTS